MDCIINFFLQFVNFGNNASFFIFKELTKQASSTALMGPVGRTVAINALAATGEAFVRSLPALKVCSGLH